MSINSALLAGTSGLAANSSAMAAISDNIANVNSVGYKRTDTLFDSLFQADSSISSSYNAGGVKSTTRSMVNLQGQLAASGNATDMAISGDGFFVVGSSASPEQSSDFLYTRAGSFDVDETGVLRNSAGYYLMGWPVAADGTVAANPSDLGALEPVNIGSISGTAEATSTAQINANLQASTEISADEATYDATNTANNMASGAVTPDFVRSITVFDSQGGSRTLQIGFLKSSANPNEWHAEVWSDPAADVDLTAPLVDGQIATGVVTFDENGQFDDAATTLPTSLGVEWTAATGVTSPQSVELVLGGADVTGGLTQFDSPSVLVSTSIDGSAFNDNPQISIDDQGFVIASFGDGVVRRVYQIPLATFPNPNGLTSEVGGAYRISGDSGDLALKVAKTGGAGVISAASLESSNVDLATEFTNLIKTQRAYSASSKIITTADEMLDELIRMKR